MGHQQGIISSIIGAAMAYYITTLPAQQETSALWYIFISGMIAICAMILPGISGSFILLLLGSYAVVLNGIHERDIVLIAVFGFGLLLDYFLFHAFSSGCLSDFMTLQ
jgi:putative membrane protein